MFTINGDYIYSFFFCQPHYYISRHNEGFFVRKSDIYSVINCSYSRFKSDFARNSNQNYVILIVRTYFIQSSIFCTCNFCFIICICIFRLEFLDLFIQ